MKKILIISLAIIVAVGLIIRLSNLYSHLKYKTEIETDGHYTQTEEVK